MDGKTAVEIIKSKLPENGSPEKVRLQKGGLIRVYLVEGGVDVEDFSGRSFLPWNVFEEAVDLPGDPQRTAQVDAILIWAGI